MAIVTGTASHQAASATQNATGGTVTYDVEYRLVGGATTTVTGVKNTFLDVSGLDPESNYEWRVRKTVGTSSSAYSSYQAFTTAPDWIFGRAITPTVPVTWTWGRRHPKTNMRVRVYK